MPALPYNAAALIRTWPLAIRWRSVRQLSPEKNPDALRPLFSN